MGKPWLSEIKQVNQGQKPKPNLNSSNLITGQKALSHTANIT